MRGEDRVLELQEVDSMIDRLEARRAELESGDEVRAARGVADQAEAHLGEVRLAIDGEAREQRRLEHDIDTLQQKGADEEKRMYDGSIVNQKELEALQHEIANIKQRKGRFEDDLLERMQRVEELQRLGSEAEEALAAARERLETVGAGSTAELERIAGDLAERRTVRDELSPKIDDELLELYEELRRSKKGVGAAAVVDGICQGCHQTLSAVERDRLKRADIKRCEYCRRILVFG